MTNRVSEKNDLKIKLLEKENETLRQDLKTQGKALRIFADYVGGGFCEDPECQPDYLCKDCQLINKVLDVLIKKYE